MGTEPEMASLTCDHSNVAMVNQRAGMDNGKWGEPFNPATCPLVTLTNVPVLSAPCFCLLGFFCLFVRLFVFARGVKYKPPKEAMGFV